MDNLAVQIPVSLPPETIDKLEAQTIGNLGGNFMIFKRVSYSQAVLDFCDNWETNVLMPVFLAVRAAGKKAL